MFKATKHQKFGIFHPGLRGPSGEDGSKGDSGLAGPKGEPGMKGAKGDMGPRGKTIYQGFC